MRSDQEINGSAAFMLFLFVLFSIVFFNGPLCPSKMEVTESIFSLIDF